MIDTSQVPSPPSPTVHGRYEATNKRGFTLLAGIRASENNPVRLPSCLFKATSGCVGQDGNTRRYFVRLTVAGAAQAGDRPMPCTKKMYLCGPKLLLPVELRHVNHTASTNRRILATIPFSPLKCAHVGKLLP
jgi:hypothetical protein